MKNRIAKVVASVGAAALGLVVSSVAYAAEFSTSTAPTLVNQTITDVAVIIGAVIGSILGLLAALLGLGWGIRKFKAYITGRKF